MRFENFNYIYAYLLLLPCLLLWWWEARRRNQALAALADAQLRAHLLPQASPGLRIAKQLLKLVALVFLVLSLMQPQWGEHEEEIKMRGVNLMLLVDVSSSMLAQDIKPNRLEREKYKLHGLLDMLSGDRVGIIAFAGQSALLAPLTSDYDTLKDYVDDLSPESISLQGTNLTAAFKLALESFPASKPEETSDIANVVLLLTDGEDHSQEFSQMREQLIKNKVQVFVLGLGTPEGAPVPEPGGGFKSNFQGKMVVSKLDENFLQDLALATGGAYVRSVGSEADLQELYLKGIRGVLNAGELKVSKKKILENRYYWPLAIAAAALALSLMLPAARGPLRLKRRKTQVS